MTMAILTRHPVAGSASPRRRAQEAFGIAREVVMLWFQSVGDGARFLQSWGGVSLAVATVLLGAATAGDVDLHELGKLAKLPAFVSALGLAVATSYKAIALGRQRVRKARLENDEKEEALKDANEARDRAERGRAMAEAVARKEAEIAIQEMQDAYNRKAEASREKREKNTLIGQIEALTKRMDLLAAEAEALRENGKGMGIDLAHARQSLVDAEIQHRTERDVMMAEIARLTQVNERLQFQITQNTKAIDAKAPPPTP